MRQLYLLERSMRFTFHIIMTVVLGILINQQMLVNWLDHSQLVEHVWSDEPGDAEGEEDTDKEEREGKEERENTEKELKLYHFNKSMHSSKMAALIQTSYRLGHSNITMEIVTPPPEHITA